MAALGYLIESSVLTFVAVILFSLFVWQARVERAFRARATRKPDNSPWHVQLLKDVRLCSLVSGLGASFFAIVLSLDSSRVHGLHSVVWVYYLLRRIITFFLFWTGLSYCTSALQASYVASKIIESKPGRITYNMYSLALFMYLPILVYTTILHAMSFDNTSVTPLPYLLYLVLSEACIIVSFDVSFCKFRSRISDLVEFDSVGKAYIKLRRIFIFLHTILLGIMAGQITWIATGYYKDDFEDESTQPSDKYELRDQFSLYLQLLIIAFILGAFWRPGGTHSPKELSDFDVYGHCTISDADMNHYPGEELPDIQVSAVTGGSSLDRYTNDSRESISLSRTPEPISPASSISPPAITTPHAHVRRVFQTRRSSSANTLPMSRTYMKRGNSDTLINPSTIRKLNRIGIQVVDEDAQPLSSQANEHITVKWDEATPPQIQLRNLRRDGSERSVITEATIEELQVIGAEVVSELESIEKSEHGSCASLDQKDCKPPQ